MQRIMVVIFFGKYDMEVDNAHPLLHSYFHIYGVQFLYDPCSSILFYIQLWEWTGDVFFPPCVLF